MVQVALFWLDRDGETVQLDNELRMTLEVIATLAGLDNPEVQGNDVVGTSDASLWEIAEEIRVFADRVLDGWNRHLGYTVK